MPTLFLLEKGIINKSSILKGNEIKEQFRTLSNNIIFSVEISIIKYLSIALISMSIQINICNHINIYKSVTIKIDNIILKSKSYLFQSSPAKIFKSLLPSPPSTTTETAQCKPNKAEVLSVKHLTSSPHLSEFQLVIRLLPIVSLLKQNQVT